MIVKNHPDHNGYYWFMGVYEPTCIFPQYKGLVNVSGDMEHPDSVVVKFLDYNDMHKYLYEISGIWIGPLISPF